MVGCNRAVLGILAAHSLSSIRITGWLDRIAESKGYPQIIRVDNGPENISKHFQGWADKHKINIRYIQLGKPAQNTYIERVNRTYCESNLDMYLLQNIKEVQRMTNNWIIHYSEKTPHELPNNLTPMAYEQKLKQIHSIC